MEQPSRPASGGLRALQPARDERGSGKRPKRWRRRGKDGGGLPGLQELEIYLKTGGYVGKVYHCKDCSYMGALVVEADDEMVEAIKRRGVRPGKEEGEGDEM